MESNGTFWSVLYPDDPDTLTGRPVATATSTQHHSKMNDLPPEDLPDEITIGPVGPIPIIDDDDPRFEAERSAWSSARTRAQALHSVEELLDGLADDDWRVRFESISRLIARWRNDARTPLAVGRIAEHDPVWQVRARAMTRLYEFDPSTSASSPRRSDTSVTGPAAAP